MHLDNASGVTESMASDIIGEDQMISRSALVAIPITDPHHSHFNSIKTEINKSVPKKKGTVHKKFKPPLF